MRLGGVEFSGRATKRVAIPFAGVIVPQRSKASSPVGRGAPKRDNIVRTALRLFSVNGYAGTSSRQIAIEAGVSEGVIFHHFPTKLDILKQIFAENRTFAGEVQAIFDRIGDEPVGDVLGEVARRFSEALETDGREAELFNVIIGESRFNPELYDIFQTLVSDVSTMMAQFIASRAEREGLRQDMPFEVVMQSVFGAYLLFFLTNRHLPNDERIARSEVYSRQVLDLVLSGLRRPAATTALSPARGADRGCEGRS